MEELISVIVPIYNVELYLKECLESIINQSYKNLEIILVDDGSNDRSGSICDEYKAKDTRIKVVHQANKGLAVARNVGIENAGGRFLTFVDSDDYIHKDMIKVLHDNIKKYDADISVCDYSNNEDLHVDNIDDIKMFCTLEEMLGQLYNEYGICFGTAWGKLYKRNVFDEIRYPENKKYEDTFIIHRVYENVAKLVFSDNKLYYYRIRKDSLINSKYSLKNLDEIDAIYDRMNFVKERNFEYFYVRDFYRYLNALRKNYKGLKKYFPVEKVKRRELIKEFNRQYNLKTRKFIINRKIRWGLDVFYLKSLLIEKIGI